MSAIGPGDWVECLQNRLATTLPPRGLVVGRVYRVTGAGVTPPDDAEPGVPWVCIAEAPCRPGRWGYRAAWFRPVLRPDETLTTRLMEPLPDALAPTLPERVSEPETA